MKYIKTFFLLLSTFLFISCGENTKNKIIPDIISIQIDNSTNNIYATDTTVDFTASVTYDDNTTANITSIVKWSTSNKDLITISSGKYSVNENGGESNISIEYEGFSDSVSIKIYGLKSGSLFIDSADINYTGTYLLTAKGEFIDIDTNETKDINRSISKNIIWSATNSAVISDINTIDIITGDTNVTASVFDINTTKTYTIN